MIKNITLKLRLQSPDTGWIQDSIFEALEEDEEMKVFETTVTGGDSDTNMCYVTIYCKMQAYHNLEWITKMVLDQLEPGETMLDVKYA